jgi:hypothetical protein
MNKLACLRVSNFFPLQEKSFFRSKREKRKEIKVRSCKRRPKFWRNEEQKEKKSVLPAATKKTRHVNGILRGTKLYC